MEQMLPELEELEERGYFTRIEIKQILRRRAYFEYLMKRKAALKADILRSALPVLPTPNIDVSQRIHDCLAVSHHAGLPSS